MSGTFKTAAANIESLINKNLYNNWNELLFIEHILSSTSTGVEITANIFKCATERLWNVGMMTHRNYYQEQKKNNIREQHNQHKL